MSDNECKSASVHQAGGAKGNKTKVHLTRLAGCTIGEGRCQMCFSVLGRNEKPEIRPKNNTCSVIAEKLLEVRTETAGHANHVGMAAT